MEKIKLNPYNRRYHGSKTKLIDKIHEVINKEEIKYSSFLDLFSGTGVVGYSFNSKDISVFFNDFLVSNYYTYQAWFGYQEISLPKIEKIIFGYNNLDKLEHNYVSLNFGNTYFSVNNCKKIGFIRDDIEIKHKRKEINDREKAILITSLLVSLDKIANTVGHYDAYRKNGDIDKDLILYELDIPLNSTNMNNQIFCEDANDLVKRIKADIVYIDPPYNSRQYSDAYHFLENIAEWKKPDVFGIAKKYDRSSKKSQYCLKQAPYIFNDLIQNINAKYIIVSYNNMENKGNSRSNAKISDFEIINTLSQKCKVIEYSFNFPQFNTGKTQINDHKERLFLCKVGEFERKQNPYVDIDVKSPLNYTGGKFKLLSQLKEKFPEEIDTFVDLFGGGFNVGINIDSKCTVYNDSQNQVARVIKVLSKYDFNIIENEINSIVVKYNLSNSSVRGYDYYNCNSNSGLGSYNKAGYYKLRSVYNNSKDCYKRDLMLLTLIIFSFNNQIRFNSKGEYNMPVGKRDFNNSIRKNLILFTEKIKNINLRIFNLDFEKVEISENSFVYCDPPYSLGTASYNESKGWTNNDEARLLNYLVKLDLRNIKFALSNVIEHKGIKNQRLIDWCITNHFNINHLNHDYNNSNYQKKNKNDITSEVLITNY